ncbi:MAG: tetratricopeptide repeat protein [Sandaracinus sp.]|nr:tetratricopeptide repeat protein [Sandaracinus sp.]MCB9612331.1 tetratricopeptide repeat protein [Sandaracinus sp.]MCB9633463.1 tetratricopeptide repeat protein [Sandaracinus sp.]
MTRASILFLALALACGSSNEPTSSPEPTAETPAEPPIGETPPEVAPEPLAAAAGTKRAASRPSITAAQRRELRAAIRDGRVKTRAGDHTGALADFRRALTIDAQSARLRCEAGYVAFRAGQLDDAERWIQLALGRLPSDPPDALKIPVAMCLFNAGLVYEARDRKDDAREAWTRSLALRPNATVQRRLDALGAAEAPVPLTGSFETLARRLRDTYCEDGSGGFVREDLESCDQIDENLRAPTGTSSPAFDARLVEHSVLVMGSDMRATLVVKAGERVRTVHVASLYSPGSMGMSADYQVQRFELVDVIPGGAAEVVLEVSQQENDEDMGVCERTGATDLRTWVCGLVDEAIHCAALPMESTDYFERDEGCCEEGDECDPPVSETTGYRYTLAFEAGNVVVTRGAAPTQTEFSEGPLANWVGRHSLEALLREEARMTDSMGMGATY